MPGARRARRVAATSLLMVVTGSLVSPPVAAEPTGPATPVLRLEPAVGSGVSSVTLPLARSLRDAGAGERRTASLGATSFSLVALTWRGADPALRVRTRSDGEWGRWLPAPALTDLPDAGDEGRAGVRGTEPLWVGPSDAVQVSLRGARPRALSLVLIDPGVRASDRSAATGPTVRPRAALPDGAPRPEIRSRRDWSADEGWRTSPPRYNTRLKQVHVHHTVTGNDYARRDVPGLIRGMYRYHTHDLGWSDIGYNFLVDRFGQTWLGRAGGAARRVRGAHTLGFNNTSTGIAVIGNFEGHAPPDAVRRAIVRLAAWKLDRNGRDPEGQVWVRSQGSDLYRDGERVRLPVIDGHRDTNQTACPGQDLYDLLPSIRHRAQRRVDRY
jgi:uncharacterized protein with LGFP repeats